MKKATKTAIRPIINFKSFESPLNLPTINSVTNKIPIEITNPISTTTKELVIFRDSFASSITPLLINYYNKIMKR